MLRILLALVLALLPASGARAMTLPVLGVTIAGSDKTSQLMSATWNLGIPDILSDLSPNTASLSFKGQLTIAPADAVVITAGGTAMWTGRLDSYVETRDTKGNYWSTVTATDLIGALGKAYLKNYSVPNPARLDTLTESTASTAGITIDVVDSSSPGLVNVEYPTATYTGDLLALLSDVAHVSNAMMALQHDGTIACWTREALSAGLLSNGTFDTNTTGWSNVSSGAISRVTASPFAGAGNARIVSSSTIFSGADATITHTFRKGHTYRLAGYARTISGSAVVNFGLGDVGASDRQAVAPTLTGSWVGYNFVDWTPSADRTSVTVNLRNNAAASNTFEVDSLAVYEVVNATDVGGSIVTWEKTTSIDVDINRWLALIAGGGGGTPVDQKDAADINTYGERTYDASTMYVEVGTPLVDWYTSGGSQRPILTSGELVVTSSASPILALDPLDWVNDGTTDWQIMSMSWSAAPGEPWHVTITGDNLISLL